MNKFRIIKIIILLIVLGVGLLFWMRYISTKGLVIKEYPIKTEKLNENYDGFKIVQFTDLHYGSTIGIEEVKNIVSTINKQNADIVVFTGDLFDNNVKVANENIDTLTEELNKINANIKVYGIPGNHDYDNKDNWDYFIEKTNWKILTNTYDLIYTESNEPIVFVGLDDYWEGTPDYKEAYQYLNDSTKDFYTILLLHEPDQVDHINDGNEENNFNFDLALAGHSHLGQVRLPFIGATVLPYGSKKYYDEHYILGDGKDLYISGGLGTSVLKIRFMNKPSINVYRFYTK